MKDRKCSECGKKISKVNKTGLCLVCYNISQRVLPDIFCEVCNKQLNRKRKAKDGLCRRCGLQKRNKDPEFIKKVSDGVKRSYKEKPELLKLRSKIGKNYGWGGNNKHNFRKMMEEKGSWRKLSDRTKFDIYREEVRNISNENYQKHFYYISNAKKRSREWHLDHKVSISYGFENGVDVDIIGHWKNLEVISSYDNVSKHTRCSVELSELMREINEA